MTSIHVSSTSHSSSSHPPSNSHNAPLRYAVGYSICYVRIQVRGRPWVWHSNCAVFFSVISVITQHIYMGIALLLRNLYHDGVTLHPESCTLTVVPLLTCVFQNVHVLHLVPLRLRRPSTLSAYPLTVFVGVPFGLTYGLTFPCAVVLAYGFTACCDDDPVCLPCPVGD